MNLEEQVRTYKELGRKIEELEKQKKTLGTSIMQHMVDKTLPVKDYLVRRYSRISVKLSLEEARLLNATKMEESVDKDKIKTLYQQGEQIQGVSETSIQFEEML